MAMRFAFVCSGCRRRIHVWEDGKPYYRDERGKKRYVPHPSWERHKATAVELDVFCTGCGVLSVSDSSKPRKRCRGCRATSLIPAMRLEGVSCPQCRTSTFEVDPMDYAIS